MGMQSWAMIEFINDAKRYLIRKQRRHEPLDIVDQKIRGFVVAWDDLTRELRKSRKHGLSN